VLLVLAGCGSSDADDQAGEAAGPEGSNRPSVVVTTSILGDVVTELVGDQADVTTIMPVGADPHDFQASAQEINRLLAADALIVNGAGFEEGLLDVIDSAEAEGVPIFEAIDPVATLEFGEGSAGHEGDHEDDDEHGDEGGEHSDEHDDEEGEHGHEHEGVDPHFFTDPARMADAVRGVATFLETELDGLDEEALDEAVNAYLVELDALDSEIEELVSSIPAEQRVLVTNHEVFSYFADRYGFELVGAVIPGGSTADSASAGELAELAELIEAEGVPAVFADTSSPDDLVETLAAEVGDIEVVELYSESLGDAGSDGASYLQMVRTNASRISAALT